MIASIVIPSFDQRIDYLGAALNSALAQTVPCEVIIVDDGSAEAISTTHPNVRVIRHDTNLGISAALNTGIRAMSTDWFCWLPSDDLFAPRKVELQRAALFERKAFASFHQYYTFTNSIATPGGQSTAWDWTSHLKQQRQLGVGCAINGLTTMIHRSVFERVGYFDTSFSYGQDWDMWARIALQYEWLAMDDVLAYRRQSGDNLTARINADDSKRRIRDAEDQRIRERYGLR